MENTKIINIKNILMILVIMISIISLGTFAWLSYRSNDTAMVLKIGEIDGMSVTLKPYQINSSLNPVTTYNSGISIDVTANNKKSSSDNFKLFYKIDSIDSELVNSAFKYTITKSTNNGSTYTEVKTGDFSTATSNSELEIYKESVPGNDTTYLYKVYLWIDGNMGDQSSMQGKVFTGELRAEVSLSPYVYTANLYDYDVQGYNSVWIGQTIPTAITQYSTPAATISSLEAAYASANSGATASLPFYLRHTVGNGSLWCVSGTDGYSYCIYSSQSECNANVSGWNHDDVTYSCVNNTVTNGVIESYVGFEVSSTMATANPGMTAGTYYLKGGDNGAAYEENKATLLSAFGSTYCTDYSSNFYCIVSGLSAYAISDGRVSADDALGSNCYVYADGSSYCGVDSSSGGGGR